MNKYTDQEKIDFFNTNWKHIEKIIDIIQTEKFGYIKAGTNVLKWLAEWLETHYGWFCYLPA